MCQWYKPYTEICIPNLTGTKPHVTGDQAVETSFWRRRRRINTGMGFFLQKNWKKKENWTCIKDYFC